MYKTIVTFASPGTFFSESSSLEIDGWDERKAIELSASITERYNAKPYGFTMQQYAIHPDVIDEDGNVFKCQDKLIKKSGNYFLGGELFTYDQVVERNDPSEEILRSNMRGNGMWVVCVNTNSYRSTLPFEEKDILLDTDGNVVERGDAPKFVEYRKRMTEQRDAEYKAKYG